MNEIFLKKLQEIVDENRLNTNEPMKAHTTFRVGGPADYFVMPKTIEEVKQILELCKEQGMPYYILGNGSNLLVGDKGYRGVVIQIYKEMSTIEVKGDVICVQAGALPKGALFEIEAIAVK